MLRRQSSYLSCNVLELAYRYHSNLHCEQESIEGRRTSPMSANPWLTQNTLHSCDRQLLNQNRLRMRRSSINMTRKAAIALNTQGGLVDQPK